ncbi:MAG TPA: hypothetical protein VFW95_04895 [Candidatus Limnocylindria bacterium]|nr:hypothetical protein [Candidatus Limnocylindria bacterium]
MNTAHDHDRALLDRLCLLRALYAQRGDRDTVSCISIADVIRHAEELLSEPPRPSASPAA